MNTSLDVTNETAARLRRAVTRLNRKLRQSSLGSVSPAQASMLASVEKLGRPSLGDLAAAEQLKPPSVTRLARAMTEAGLIVCEGDLEDRRCTRVRLTPRGRRELATIRRRKTELLERRLMALSEPDRRHAEDLVMFLEALLEDL